MVMTEFHAMERSRRASMKRTRRQAAYAWRAASHARRALRRGIARRRRRRRPGAGGSVRSWRDLRSRVSKLHAEEEERGDDLDVVDVEDGEDERAAKVKGLRGGAGDADEHGRREKVAGGHADHLRHHVPRAEFFGAVRRAGAPRGRSKGAEGARRPARRRPGRVARGFGDRPRGGAREAPTRETARASPPSRRRRSARLRRTSEDRG